MLSVGITTVDTSTTCDDVSATARGKQVVHSEVENESGSHLGERKRKELSL